MTKMFLTAALYALLLPPAAAQASSAPRLEWTPVLQRLAPVDDPTPVAWAESNRTVGHLQGHVGHLRGRPGLPASPGQPGDAASGATR